MRIASFNVENLFERARPFRESAGEEGALALKAFERFNEIVQKDTYTAADRAGLLADLEILRVLTRTAAGSLRLNPEPHQAWARLRENRGDFLRQPVQGDAVIVASGRADWIGWAELIPETVDDLAVRMTARVIADVDADVIGLVEAESRTALVRFNQSLLDSRYAHAMLVDGNDLRGIDVGLLTKDGYAIRSVRSHVDDMDPHPRRKGLHLFSRDCPVYELRTALGATVWVLLNHFKSQSWTSGNPDPLRRRQAARTREIYEELVAGGAEFVVVMGDFNKAPPPMSPSLEPLLGPGTPLVDTFTLPGFDTGGLSGTFQSCTDRNRLDYILFSPALAATVTGGGINRSGLWGTPTNKKRPAKWAVYDELDAGVHAASDHAALFVDLDV